MMRTGLIRLVTLPLLFCVLCGCETLDVVTQLGTAVAVSQGAISEEQGSAIRKSSTAVGQAFTDITPEQEYYIGRAVGATLLDRYRPFDRAAVNRYLSQIGRTLALSSELPETFGGYHFLVLDSDEINAFAAPGGLIFVSRGMLRCCRNEEEVAAVLAHEIGHVQLRHGLQAIKKSRLTSALTIIGTEGAKQFGGKELAELTSAFEGSIQDVTTTLVNNGYSRAFEREADKAALTILARTGYDPGALASMLAEMGRRLKPGGADFARTHPDPEDRIAELTSSGRRPADADIKLRRERFQGQLGGI
jgi:predicted Zn-dependent protease